MGFLKFLQKKLEEATKNTQTSSGTIETKKTFDLDKAYFDFEDHYWKTCDKMEEKIYNAEPDHINPYNINPDKNIAGFKRMLELCHELEDFCTSKGPGGVAYFKENYSHIYQEIQSNYDDYMENDYAEAKEYFESEKAKQKAIKNLASKILKEINKSEGSAMQKDLRKQFPKGEPDYFNQAITMLLESGKITKFKDGKFVIYKVN